MLLMEFTLIMYSCLTLYWKFVIVHSKHKCNNLCSSFVETSLIRKNREIKIYLPRYFLQGNSFDGEGGYLRLLTAFTASTALFWYEILVIHHTHLFELTFENVRNIGYNKITNIVANSQH